MCRISGGKYIIFIQQNYKSLIHIKYFNIFKIQIAKFSVRYTN